MEVGFIILCPERNIGGIKNTVGSIRHHCNNRECICITPEDTTASEIKEMKAICPTYKGKDTVTSLINTGVDKIKSEWAFFLFSGSRVMHYLEKRFFKFAQSEKDILFPVIDRKKLDFIEGSFNGILLNVNTFKKIGGFPTAKMFKDDLNEFEMAKLLWALDAVEYGCKFKGIVGMRII